MSERVTWAQCPKCGRSAAVGWRLMTRTTGAPAEQAPAEEVPVEYDCPSGCELDSDELRRAFDSPG